MALGTATITLGVTTVRCHPEHRVEEFPDGTHVVTAPEGGEKWKFPNSDKYSAWLKESQTDPAARLGIWAEPPGEKRGRRPRC